jgi:hypothetical protein
MMTRTTETATLTPAETVSATSDHPTFVTPEMIEKNPVLAAAGTFAGDPYWRELMAEIKRGRARQRRREARRAK